MIKNINIKYIWFNIHVCILIFFIIMTILLPTKYFKYIFFIPYLISLQWIIFDGCILNKLHETIDYNYTSPSIHILNVIKKINNNCYNYLNNKCIKIKKFDTFISTNLICFWITILLFRYIFNINLI